MNYPAPKAAPATRADLERQLWALRRNYADLLAKYEALNQTPITIVVDLTGGALHAVYATRPIDVITISRDSDDIAEALNHEPEHLALTMDADPVYLSNQSSQFDPEVVAHYVNEQRRIA